MKKNINLYFEISLLLLFILLFPFIRKDILIFSFYTVVYLYVVRFKIGSIRYLGLSTIISIIWLLIAKDFYFYSSDMVKFFSLEIYPLLAWSLGLFGLKELYEYIAPKNKVKSILTLTIIYILLLIILETVSYHVIGFKNSLNYPGLPICDCIHLPLFMQIYYLTIGPIYYILTILLDKFIKKD
ncbi:MAG: hypothetical protein QXK76_03315 [Candidatus Woesearchaeota archaeon]